ncbi:hypothetical protein [Kitasatospora sp. NPDC004531]
MWADAWAVLTDADREFWDYVPLERVGPLRFGMSIEGAAAAMPACGFTSDPASGIGRFGPFEQVRTRFRAVDAPFHRTDVVAYSVGPMGLTCVAVDALTGPQVMWAGLPTGRPTSLRAFGRAHGPPGEHRQGHRDHTGNDIGSQDLDIMPCAQRAGDRLLTRLVLGRPNDWANTMHDCIPADELHGHH